MELNDWKDEYKQWKLLKPFESKLLDEGAKTLSQTWLLNQMWCEWRDIKKIKETELPKLKIQEFNDPWYE